MECELHSKEFFVQVGMLVIEGRTPQDSERGRIEGKHVLQGKSRHICEDKDEEVRKSDSYPVVIMRAMAHSFSFVLPMIQMV